MGASYDDPIERLIERSAALKVALLDFAERPRYAADLEDAFEDRLAGNPNPEDGDIANAYDHFFFQHRLHDGRTFVELFVDQHSELPEMERTMLLGWRDVVEGIFAVSRREGDVLILDNLIDELTYRTRSNKGPAALDQIPTGAFIIARVIPVGDLWVLSGALQILPKSGRLHIYRAAAEMALQFPHLAFRNPDKLAQAWKFQRDDRAAFIALVGVDTVIIPGHEVLDLLRRFRHFQFSEWRDETGTTAAERSAAATGEQPDLDSLDLSRGLDDLVEAETVGVIYDGVDGMNFYRDFGLVAEVFARPELLDDADHAAAVADYLEEPDLSPLPLRRLAEQHPTHVNQVFRRLIGRADFSWRRDGEELLRFYKPSYYAHEPVPAIAPLSETLSNALRQDPIAFRNVGRNDPCPCGSGKKYKHCCGAA